MQTPAIRISRRAVLARGATLLAGVTLTLTLDANRPARAKAAKSDLLYQDGPHDGKKCAECKFFSPDGGGANTGTCAVVEGTVNANGWCLAFSPKI